MSVLPYNVYGDADGAERLIPFDVIPRLISSKEWAHLSAGVIQRVRALNMFLHDIYHKQEIIQAGIVPYTILSNPQYRPEMFGVDVPNQIYAHIAGVDLVRTGESQFYVLEDNLRAGLIGAARNPAAFQRLLDHAAPFAIAPVEQRHLGVH